jgi:hypothetical protein
MPPAQHNALAEAFAKYRRPQRYGRGLRSYEATIQCARFTLGTFAKRAVRSLLIGGLPDAVGLGSEPPPDDCKA